LRYDTSTPSSLGTEVTMSVVTPITGSGNVVVNAGNYFIINIPKSGDRCVFDPMNSFLRFKLNVQNSQGIITLAMGGSCDSVFRRLEVFHGSNVLEQLDQYNNLSAMLLNSQVNSYDRSNQWSILKGTNPANPVVFTGDTISTTGAGVAGLGSRYFSTTLLSGVVGSLSRCYIPLFALNGNISFRITLDSPVAAFVSSGARSADLTNNWVSTTDGVWLSDIEFHASIIHCSEQVMQAISMPMYSIPTEMYNCFEINWTPSNQIEQLLPYKYVSLKTIFLSMRNPNVLNNNGYHLNSYGSQNIYQFSLRCGSRIIPPNRVKCPQVQNNIEAFEELKKSFHSGGNCLASLGCHNVTSYNKYVSNDATGTFQIGLDLEQFSGKSGQIISGLDTTASDLFFSGTWSTVVNDGSTNNTSILADFYSHYNSVFGNCRWPNGCSFLISITYIK